MHFAKLSTVSAHERKKCIMKLGKYWKRKSSQKGLKSSDFCIEKVSKKYLNINGKVSKDKWPSMFRYFAKYVKTLFFIALSYAASHFTANSFPQQIPLHSRVPFYSYFPFIADSTKPLYYSFFPTFFTHSALDVRS